MLRATAAVCGAFAGLVLATWMAALAGLDTGPTVAVAGLVAGLFGLVVARATAVTAGQLVWDGRGQWLLSPWPDGEARSVRPVWAIDAGPALLLVLHDDGPSRRGPFRRRTWTIVRRGGADDRRWARVRASLAWQQAAGGVDGASWAP